MSSTFFSLIVQIPGREPVRHDLSGDQITIGRSPDNKIQILVAEVSVKHGELVKSGDQYRIVDLGSTNGTLVNGAKVNGAGADLAPMDKLLLGATIPAYFVPSAVLAATPLNELIASLEAAPKAVVLVQTAPVAVAVPVATAVPAPAGARPGAPGVPPRPGIPAPAVSGRPPAAVAVPAGIPAPVASGAATVRLEQVRPAAGAGPVRLAGPAPGGAPRPPISGMVKAPPVPGGASAPQPKAPLPLKRPPTVGGAPPSIPLPKGPSAPGK
jgi:hypothetical protein